MTTPLEDDAVGGLDHAAIRRNQTTEAVRMTSAVMSAARIR